MKEKKNIKGNSYPTDPEDVRLDRESEASRGM